MYQRVLLAGQPHYLKRLRDGACIPIDPRNRAYECALTAIAAGEIVVNTVAQHGRPAVQPITILALGDSITRGVPVPPGYRRYLIPLLGERFRWVGTQMDGPGLIVGRHEGRDGWKISDLRTTLVLSGLVASLAPSVILLGAGTNDLAGAPVNGVAVPGNPTTAASDMAALLSSLTAALPTARILVWQLPPLIWGAPAQHAAFSANRLTFIGLVAANVATRGPLVRYVTVNWATTTGAPGAEVNPHLSLPTDGVHPSDVGYQQLASDLYPAILEAA